MSGKKSYAGGIVRLGQDGGQTAEGQHEGEERWEVMVYKQRKKRADGTWCESKNWSYKFEFNGREIRKTTKQSNKRVAESIEAAAKTALAKGEVGIIERKPVPTLAAFADERFLPFVRTSRRDGDPDKAKAA